VQTRGFAKIMRESAQVNAAAAFMMTRSRAAAIPLGVSPRKIARITLRFRGLLPPNPLRFAFSIQNPEAKP
jgi:hypothetical protein